MKIPFLSSLGFVAIGWSLSPNPVFGSEDTLRSMVELFQKPPSQWIQRPPKDLKGYIEVEITDATTGKPIPGADLRVIESRGFAKATSNASGVAAVGLPSEKTRFLTITVSHPLYVPSRLRWYHRTNEIALPARLSLKLEPGQNIGGQVLSPEMRPIEGAVVELLMAEKTPYEGKASRDPHLWRQRITTDAAGRWSYPRAPADLDQLTLKIRHPLFLETQNHVEGGSAKESALLSQSDEIIMNSGAEVVGRVLGPNGQPVPGAAVDLRATKVGAAKAASTTTDAEGRFFFAAVENGTITLFADAPGMAPGLLRYELNGEAPLFEVSLEEPQQILGRVLSVAGEPIEGVTISVEKWRGTRNLRPIAVTDDAGYFLWKEAPEDQILFRISKTGYLSLQAALPVNQEQELILSSRRILRGTVREERSGKPIKHFQIQLGTSEDGGKTVEWFGNDLPFKHGAYRINLDEPINRLVLRAVAPGFEPARSDVISKPSLVEKIHFSLKTKPSPQAR